MQASVVSAMWRTEARLWHAAVRRGMASSPCTLLSIHLRRLPRRDSAVVMLELLSIISVSVNRLLRARWRVCRSMSASQKAENHFSEETLEPGFSLTAGRFLWTLVFLVTHLCGPRAGRDTTPHNHFCGVQRDMDFT